jgi:hypothetical protein
MAAFSPAQYEAIVNKLVTGGNDLSGKICELPPAAQKTLDNPWAISLTVCAAGGLAFYVALNVIVVKLIVEFAGAIIAVGSGAFSAVGAFVVITDAGITSGMIWAAVGALTALLGAQATQMVVMHGEATDGNMFPGGRWPVPGVQNFSDASMRDGDTTDWYLEK